jgi:hypothetical protein
VTVSLNEIHLTLKNGLPNTLTSVAQLKKVKLETKTIKNRPIFMKNGKPGLDQFFRFVKNQLRYFEKSNIKKE